MKTFNQLINNKLGAKDPVNLKSLAEGEAEIGIPIPPDYCYLLLNSDGYINNNRWQISADGTNPIVSIDDFVSLEWLIKERSYDMEDEDAVIYRENFLRIAGCYNQDRILIGFTEGVLNQIYFYDYDNEKLIKISDSIFDLVCNHLISENDK